MQTLLIDDDDEERNRRRLGGTIGFFSLDAMSGARSLRLVAGLADLLAPERGALAPDAPEFLRPGKGRHQSGFRNPLRHRRHGEELACRLADWVERVRACASRDADKKADCARRLCETIA